MDLMLRSLICSIILFSTGYLVKSAEYVAEPLVHIDGYTPEGTLDIGDTVQLGTTVILVCRVTGIPYGVQTSYRWVCPNGPCNIGKGRNPRRIHKSYTLVLNIISFDDEGEYECTVTAGGAGGTNYSTTYRQNIAREAKVVHTTDNLVPLHSVITDVRQFMGSDEQLVLNCSVVIGNAVFYYKATNAYERFSQHPINHFSVEMIGKTEILTVNTSNLTTFRNSELYCREDPLIDIKSSHYFYLYLSHTADNILPKPTITSIMVNDRGKIDVTMASFDGAPYGLFIALFRRTDLSIPVEVNAIHRSTEGIITGPTAIPGATYDMTVWFSSDERFTPTPAKDTLQVEEAVPSLPRDLKVSRVFPDGVELNWIPPREPNGDIFEMIVKVYPGRKTFCSNINYFNITGLEHGTTYAFSVSALNEAGKSGEGLLHYTHNAMIAENVNATLFECDLIGVDDSSVSIGDATVSASDATVPASDATVPVTTQTVKSSLTTGSDSSIVTTPPTPGVTESSVGINLEMGLIIGLVVVYGVVLLLVVVIVTLVVFVMCGRRHLAKQKKLYFKENTTDDYLNEEEKKGRSYQLANVNDSDKSASLATIKEGRSHESPLLEGADKTDRRPSRDSTGQPNRECNVIEEHIPVLSPKRRPPEPPQAPPPEPPQAPSPAPPQVPPSAPPQGTPSAPPQGTPSAPPQVPPSAPPQVPPPAPPQGTPSAPSRAPLPVPPHGPLSTPPQAPPPVPPKVPPPVPPQAPPSVPPQAPPSVPPQAPTPAPPQVPPPAPPQVPPQNSVRSHDRGRNAVLESCNDDDSDAQYEEVKEVSSRDRRPGPSEKEITNESLYNEIDERNHVNSNGGRINLSEEVIATENQYNEIDERSHVNSNAGRINLSEEAIATENQYNEIDEEPTLSNEEHIYALPNKPKK